MSTNPTPDLPTPVPRVGIVGAGVAGLAAARVLTTAGWQVTIVDKGRSVGGRLATRRLGNDGAVADHGAQFLTVRSEEMAALRDELDNAGLLVEWCRGFGDHPDGHPRYAVRGGMNQLAKWMASSVNDVRCNWLATAITRDGAGSVLIIGAAETLGFDAVIITSPIPQSLALFDASGVELGADRRLLEGVIYDPTVALIAACTASPELGGPGVRRFDSGDVSIIVDNSTKGVGVIPSVTMHASADWSRAHWDDDDATALSGLVSLAARNIDVSILIDPQIKKWRYATPTTILPERSMALGLSHGTDRDIAPIVLAGDAFGGPKIEGAYLSGLDAARRLLAT